MSEKGSSKKTWCPECDATLVYSASKMKLGSFVECPECEVTLEVVSLNPFAVDYVIDDEDWDEEEED